MLVQRERPDQLLQDYERTLSELPNLFDNYTVPYERWNHVDFLWAKDIDTLLHPRDQLYKIGLPGKLILSKINGLREDLFS